MKLFQQLLVAPAALGLMAPMAATAAELNINGVSDYSASSAEVQNITSFSDVYPTDWAYQALNNLRQRHGCVAASPNGSMTRYEAAALLNKCLENVAQVNEEEQSLLDEFGPELAVIKGRVDALESRIGEFEAGVFSSTTKLSGKTTYVIGALDDNDDQADNDSVHFVYDQQLSLDTSFTGRDLLKTTLRAGNFSANSPFGASQVAALETAHSSTSDSLDVHRSYYQFPIGDNFTATLGAKVRQDDMLAVWPSSYPSDSVLDVLTYAGANDAYSLASGQGAGLTYTTGNLAASFSFISEEGTDAGEGILSKDGSDDVTAQVAWLGDTWTVAAVYTVADNGNRTGSADADDYDAFGISGEWNIGADSAFIPTSISAGMGWKTVDNADDDGADNIDNNTDDIEDLTTWSVGFQWADAFIEGNTLGFALGTAEGHTDDGGYDDPLAYEVYYEMAVTDNITVTPAIFIVEKNVPGSTSEPADKWDDIMGALVKTTFRF